MKQVGQRPLWYAGVGALRDAVPLHDLGISAILFLATDLFDLSGREMIVCRVPLVDGEGNMPERLRLAIEIAAFLVQADTPTLVCCSNGMSRSPAIVAAALAKVDGGSADEHLKQLAIGQAADVSPALWRDTRAALA